MKFTVKLITPLVTAAAGGQADPREGLRVPELVHGMRYWLRALVAGQHDHLWARPADLRVALCAAEASLFGYAGGRSPVTVRAHLQTAYAGAEPQSVSVSSRFNMEAMREGARYDVAFTVRPADATIGPKLLAAFSTLVALGGVGRRTRRGLGSLAATSADAQVPEEWNVPTVPTGTRYRDAMEQLRIQYEGMLTSARAAFGPSPVTPAGGTGLPPIPALNSLGARVWLVAGNQPWTDALVARGRVEVGVYGAYKAAPNGAVPPDYRYGWPNGGHLHLGRGYPTGTRPLVVPSPLLTSIKCATDGQGNPFYFGVVVAWHDAVHGGSDPKRFFAPGPAAPDPFEYLTAHMNALAGTMQVKHVTL